MRRCDLEADVCAAIHVAAQLDGRKSATDEKQWYVRCPLHPKDGRKLSVRVGDYQRIVWQCWKGCSPAAVKTAMLKVGISPHCIRWDPNGAREDTAAADQVNMAEIRKLIGEQLHPVELAIAVTMLAFNEKDPRVAAEMAGISQRTYYRHRDRFLT